jgi:hypothetical protein
MIDLCPKESWIVPFSCLCFVRQPWMIFDDTELIDTPHFSVFLWEGPAQFHVMVIDADQCFKSKFLNCAITFRIECNIWSRTQSSSETSFLRQPSINTLVDPSGNSEPDTGPVSGNGKDWNTGKRERRLDRRRAGAGEKNERRQLEPQSGIRKRYNRRKRKRRRGAR